MSNLKVELGDWVVEALKNAGGEATIVEVAKHIWEHYEPELRASGDRFYDWQYQMRWSAQRLQDEGRIKKGMPTRRHWTLVSKK
ncbi:MULTISPECIES: hypothetical protein [unclassified Brevundimonas]|jgi:hypothetical protein|uniref:hypothetical protein n=1 Tax=unclassified Brevundimonas TaxID=2622653 RepID=UPI000C4EDE94|nr:MULTISPECIES: hypothetical protein [unclassified Brevundimonas]MAL89766.1 hypothetical protein [Brevundimonas sp.]HAV49272.1 hypothetical protein [Brevundimonas sp.]|tara:strand:+ start:14199 stop:14450 length:252 start_codon:yes stop_codon:yes gene_type:complete